jgi:hypothetical protein
MILINKSLARFGCSNWPALVSSLGLRRETQAQA